MMGTRLKTVRRWPEQPEHLGSALGPKTPGQADRLLLLSGLGDSDDRGQDLPWGSPNHRRPHLLLVWPWRDWAALPLWAAELQGRDTGLEESGYRSGAF